MSRKRTDIRPERRDGAEAKNRSHRRAARIQRARQRKDLQAVEAIRHRARLTDLPEPLPADPDQRLVEVYVEGYEDVAFWRGIFDHFCTPYLRFEISVPNRADLPKGKKVLLSMVHRSSSRLLLCMDSDFDYLFANRTPQSRVVNESKYIFHTFSYATENYLCYAPSLHNVCVRATKNDTRIFDFERFMHDYSCTIYPLFVWYAYSAQINTVNVFPLCDFRAAVRINSLEIAGNGRSTIEALARTVARRAETLAARHPQMVEPMKEFEEQLRARGVTPENTYLFMHGHTLMDNVVMVLLNTVCDRLRAMSIAKISGSTKEGTALRNEMSNYQNSLRPVRDVLLDNENYTECPLYKRLQRKLLRYVMRTIGDMRQRGEITDPSYITVLRHLHEKNY